MADALHSSNMPGREDCDSRQAGKELTHHTPCYCEENVYLLCQSLIKQGAVEELYVVFISNFEKKIPLWRQKASQSEDGFICWDYHVVLVERGQASSFVWDSDSTLPFPCPFQQYEREALNNGLAQSFLPPHLERCYRIVSGRLYLQHFSSDRSHMKRQDGTWYSQPPPYPCIFPKGGGSATLREYLDMRADQDYMGMPAEKPFIGHSAPYGQVFSETAFLRIFSKSHREDSAATAAKAPRISA